MHEFHENQMILSKVLHLHHVKTFVLSCYLFEGKIDLPRMEILYVPSAYFPCVSVARMPNVYSASMSGARPVISPVVMSSEVPGGRCPEIRL